MRKFGITKAIAEAIKIEGMLIVKMPRDTPYEEIRAFRKTFKGSKLPPALLIPDDYIVLGASKEKVIEYLESLIVDVKEMIRQEKAFEKVREG